MNDFQKSPIFAVFRNDIINMLTAEIKNDNIIKYFKKGMCDELGNNCQFEKCPLLKETK